MEPAEAVLRFLEGVGPGSEAEFYLRLFRSRARESFAALVVDSETMRENADGVALDLRLLSALSLTPVVVLGFHDPSRADEHTKRLRKKLDEMGLESEPLTSASPKHAIAAAAARGAVPIVCITSGDEDARTVQLSTMLSELATHKLIFLRNEGGFQLQGKVLSVVNLSDEFSSLMSHPDISAEHKALLACSRRIVLDLVPHELLVTITSPLSLVHELFTVKGAGTLLRKGARIVRHDGVAGVDIPRLQALLTSSFGRTPRPEVFERDITHAYVEERYRGAALVVQAELGAYLSKFAVTREAQGEGVGRDLWQAMIADHRVLFWRARPENPIRTWYQKQCDGRVRVTSTDGDGRDWIVFFRGLAVNDIPAAVAYALAQPVDF